MKKLSAYEAARLSNVNSLYQELDLKFSQLDELCDLEEDTKENVPKRTLRVKTYTPKLSPSLPRRRSKRIQHSDDSDEEFLGFDSGMYEDGFRGFDTGLIHFRGEIPTPERRRRTHRRQIRIRLSERTVLKPEEVTDSLLKKIWYRSSGKTYSVTGTTCHQCRQKTEDTKSVCRSETCAGVRGQFCGFCLQNRYGEDVAVALKDENWTCPPCRDICNCSICRTRDGKIPTGILLPYAQRDGFTNVKDFLASKFKDEEFE